MKVKKGTKKLVAFLLTLALVLTGIGAFTGLEGVFCIKAKAAELNRSVTAGTSYSIGGNIYVAAATADSGNVFFIRKTPTSYSYTFGELSNLTDYEYSDINVELMCDLDNAGLEPAVSIFDYYDTTSGNIIQKQGFFGVATKGQVEAATAGLYVGGWTATNVDTEKAYFRNDNAVSSGGIQQSYMSASRRAYVGFFLDLSGDLNIGPDTEGFNHIEFAVPIDEEHFPDENFRNFILEQDYGADSILTQTEIASITSMDCSSQNIADLTGIEHFTALTSLVYSLNPLSSCDLSSLTALEELVCTGVQYTSLKMPFDNGAITATVTGGGHGKFTMGSYDANEKSFMLSPPDADDTGYIFKGWSLVGATKAFSYSGTKFIVGDNHATITATWEAVPDTYTLTINEIYQDENGDEERTVTSTETYTDGEEATVTKTAPVGYSIVGDATQTVTMDQNRTVTFTYKKNTHTLTINEVYQHIDGTEERTEISTETYPYGEEATVTKTAPADYSIIGSASQTVTMDDDKTITFTYRKNDPAADPNNIVINAAHFPDENFRNFLLSQTYGADGILTPEEIASITSMDCSSQNIADLTGIEHFTALTSLVYSLNPLSTCDLSGLTALEELVCTGVQYTSLKMPFDNGAITATVTGGGHGKFTMGSYDANEKSFILSSPDADDTGYICKGWSATGATKAFSYSGTKFIVGDNHATITATWEAVPDTYTLTVNEIYLYADGTTEKTEVSTSTHEDGEEVTVTKTAPAGYTLYGEASQTYIMDEDKTAVFTYVKNASDPDPDPADPIVSDHVFTSSSLLMRWQGLSGERVVKRVGNVTITGSKQYGRLYGAALIAIDPTSLPDGKSVSVSIPQKHINLTVGGVTLTATIDFEDVTLVNTDGSRQYVVTVITDRSDLPYEDFFGKTIIGDIRYSVEFS